MNNLKPYCKVCGERVQELEDKQFNTIYLKCPHCGFISLDERFLVSFDEERAEYDLHENSIEDKGYVNYLERFLSVAVDPFVCDGKALEFGCGPGPVLAELLKRRGLSVEIYDKHYKPDESVFNASYNLITATEVLEHLETPLEVFMKLSGILVKGGVLSIMTSVPPVENADFLKWHYRREKTHISFYTVNALEVLAKKCGLEILYHDEKRITVFRKL